MTIWNPFSLSTAGRPAGPVSPPALRVIGGDATPLQLSYAQQAYYKFASMARLSVVPNPTESGFLPDGTRYTIQVIGIMTNMTIWVTAVEDLRLSGISFSLTGLAGEALPEHSDPDGFPFIYLLTPRVIKGSRRSNGNWVIRKPKFVAGGKAVNTDSTGLIYYTGLQGSLDRFVPLYRGSTYGINGNAYRHDEYSESEPFFQHFEKVGETASNTTPISFIYKGATPADRLAMQLNVVVEFDPEPRQYIELLVGKFADETNAPVGPVVSTEDLPSNLSLQWQTITFSADGRKARATATQDGTNYAMLEISITPNGTTTRIERVVPIAPQWSGVGYWQATSSTGRVIVGRLDFENPHEYGDTYPASELGFDLGSPSSYDPSQNSYNTTGTVVTPQGYSFDRRGRPVDSSATYTRISMDALTTEDYFEDGFIKRNNFTSQVTTAAGTVVTRSGQNLHSRNGEVHSGSGFDMRPVGQGIGKISIFEDIELDFIIYLDVNHSRYLSWVYTSDGGQQITSNNTTYSKKLIVRCKSRILLSQDIPENANYVHRTFIAADPMTGALVVSLQQVHNMIVNQVQKSWIFVVDDTGGRHLHEVMRNVAAGTQIKVLSNASLISV